MPFNSDDHRTVLKLLIWLVVIEVDGLGCIVDKMAISLSVYLVCDVPGRKAAGYKLNFLLLGYYYSIN